MRKEYSKPSAEVAVTMPEKYAGPGDSSQDNRGGAKSRNDGVEWDEEE